MAKEKQEKELETAIKADTSVDVAVEQNEKNMIPETTQTLSSSTIIEEFENGQLKKELPEINLFDQNQFLSPQKLHQQQPLHTD